MGKWEDGHKWGIVRLNPGTWDNEHMWALSTGISLRNTWLAYLADDTKRVLWTTYAIGGYGISPYQSAQFGSLWMITTMRSNPS